MISSILLIIFYSFLSFVIGFFPSWDGWPTAMEDTITTLGVNLGILNKIFPIDTILTILGIMFLLEFGYQNYRIINWILNKIRGSG
jgi:hypothetical protein